MHPSAALRAPIALLALLARLARQEDLNFLLTNRLPRRWMSRTFARLSRIEHHGLTRLMVAIWRQFDPSLDLRDAADTDFPSVHAVFTRRLAPGARTIDPDPAAVVSPCDGIVGAFGSIRGTELFQAKGFPYRLEDLLPDPALVDRHRDGQFITLRLTSGMYHRFHAPVDAVVPEVRYISGDTWNVNPIALQRIERLFCRNERVVLDLDIQSPDAGGQAAITIVPVAAILVAGVAFEGLTVTLHPEYRGVSRIPWGRRVRKGDELGRFEHGSTILLFATGGFVFTPTVREGARVRVGDALFRHPTRRWSAASHAEVH
ncbi:MAG: archaetidylserine decarboxylase [Gemmatimonadaceae bacterium]|nr:archaetidylserine decarboxylase [Gemmatimonadaceae bacterium]